MFCDTRTPQRGALNFRDLLILGAGSIGKSLLKIGQKQLDTFERITVLTPFRVEFDNQPRAQLVVGSAEDPGMLRNLLERRQDRSLVVNLASRVDSVRIRNAVGTMNAAYIDTSASMLPGSVKAGYDEVMTYTHSPSRSPYPQWIGWGANPGLVEIIARKLMSGHEDGVFDISIYEDDQMEARTDSGKLGVGWSPEDLIEEVMLTPSLEIREGKRIQDGAAGARESTMYWGGRRIPCRVVAHEDIWNLGLLPTVRSAKFLYALHPAVMEVLSGPVDLAYQRLEVPSDNVPLKGLDRIAVQVANSHAETSLKWETDHAEMRERHGVNAVQFQVCRSLQVAIQLLQETDFGLKAGTYCASTLPLDGKSWELIDSALAENEIFLAPCEELTAGT